MSMTWWSASTSWCDRAGSAACAEACAAAHKPPPFFMAGCARFTPLQRALPDTVQLEPRHFSQVLAPCDVRRDSMPDALQILREDHRKVKEIFRQFEDAEDQQTKKSLVDQAIVDLTVHAELEEQIFYPAVRREGGTAEMIDEAEEEHHVVDVLLDELRGMKPNEERWAAKFSVLCETVRHHIDEEEANTLPKAAELGPE